MNQENTLHDKFDIFKEDFAFLIEAGFVATKQFDEVSATRIFEAAQLLNPTSTAPRIGLGNIALNKLEIKKAIEIFSKIHEEEPDNHLAQAYLGISYLISKTHKKEGEALIQDAMKKTSDETILNLCKTALEWFKNKDVLKEKKTDSPFNFAGKKEEK